RSLGYAVAASAICLVIAYPVAYAIARHGGRYKNALVALLVVPFFANYLVRMYGWQTLLSDESMLMTWLHRLGVSANLHLLRSPRRDRRIGLRLRRFHDPADLRVAGTHGRCVDRGRPRPVRLVVAHLLHRNRSSVQGRRLRGPGARIPACDGRLHQRPAARWP